MINRHEIYVARLGLKLMNPHCQLRFGAWCIGLSCPPGILSQGHFTPG